MNKHIPFWIKGLLVLLIVSFPSLIVKGAANVGNLYITHSVVDGRISIASWIQAQKWLGWAAQRTKTAYRQCLEQRVIRADAFLERYNAEADREEPVPHPVLSPEYSLDQAAGDWVLLGYDIDEHSLEFQDVVDAWLYWQSVSGTVVTQHMQTKNLVINGGFERTATVGSYIPLGFVRERFSNHKLPFLHRRVVVREDREHLPTLCAQLDNSVSEASPSGYYSSAITCDENTLYLVSGWVWGVQNKLNVDHKEISIGLAFPGVQIPIEKQNAMLSPVASKNNWTYYAGILKPPSNATVMRVQLINWGTGIVCFDDVIVIPLELPRNKGEVIPNSLGSIDD